MTKLGAFACVVVTACGGGGKQPATTVAGPGAGSATAAPAAKSLYERLGKKEAITAVVDEFVARLAADEAIKDWFFNVDIANLKKLLVEQICNATGGPCQYTGRDMKLTHDGLMIGKDDFNALVGDLSGALDKFHVPEKEKGELLGALAGLEPQVDAPPDSFHPMDQAQLDKVAAVAATVKDPEAKRLLGVAITAGKKGQRSYAEQLFTRAEMITGAAPVAKAAAVFRAGAPERVQTAPHVIKDAGPQPKAIGTDDENDVPAPKQVAMLHGVLKIDGKAPDGLGVVMIYPAKGGYAKRQAKQRVIEQRGREFAPHVMAVPVGSTVSFPNYDAVYHNVFSLSKTKAFDLGLYKNGEARDVKVDKPGIVRLGCNIHANMAAYIVVVDAPHYVVADSDGSFAFKALAPGKYKVSVWDEKAGEPVTSELDLKAGENSQDYDLKAGPGGKSPNKFGEAR